MKKIDFFSVKVEGDSLGGTSLSYYKSTSFTEFRFSVYDDAKLCFEKLINNFKRSIDFYNSESTFEHEGSRYDVLFEDSYESCDKTLYYCIIFRHSLSFVPKILKIKLSSKSLVLDRFDFDF